MTRSFHNIRSALLRCSIVRRYAKSELYHLIWGSFDEVVQTARAVLGLVQLGVVQLHDGPPRLVTGLLPNEVV